MFTNSAQRELVSICTQLQLTFLALKPCFKGSFIYGVTCMIHNSTVHGNKPTIAIFFPAISSIYLTYFCTLSKYLISIRMSLWKKYWEEVVSYISLDYFLNTQFSDIKKDIYNICYQNMNPNFHVSEQRVTWNFLHSNFNCKSF